MKTRLFQDGDWEQFQSFAHKHFGTSHNDDRRFNEYWFKDQSRSEWTAAVLEEPERGLAGVLMILLMPAWFAGKPVRMAWISTGVVDPAARARGAGASLFLWVYRTFPLVGALSGNEFSLPINSLMGLDIPGVAMRRFVRLHDARALDLCQADGRARAAACLDREVAAAGAVTARYIASPPPDLADLWTRMRARFHCTTERSAEHFIRRYAKAPYVAYRFLEMRRGERLCAFAVLRFAATPAGPVCRIVDYMADPDASADSWQAIARQVAADGAIFSDFFVIGTAEDKALAEAGFQPADSSTGLDAVPHLLSPVEHRQWSNTFHMGGRLAKADQSWRHPDRVYFTKGDSDRDWATPYDVAQWKAAGAAATQQTGRNG